MLAPLRVLVPALALVPLMSAAMPGETTPANTASGSPSSSPSSNHSAYDGAPLPVGVLNRALLALGRAPLSAYREAHSATAAGPRHESHLSFTEAIAGAASAATVRAARLDEAMAREAIAQERRALLPRVEATAGLARATAYQGMNDAGTWFAPETTVDAKLRAQLALFDRAAWQRTAAAGQRGQSASAQREEASQAAAAAAAIAWIRLARAHAITAVRSADITLASELAELAKSRVAAEAAEPLSLARAEALLAAARSAWSSAENDRIRAGIETNLALARDPGTPVTPFEHLARLAERIANGSGGGDTAALLAMARAHRPLLASVAADLKAAEAAEAAASSLDWPRLDAYAEAGRIGPAIDDTDTSWAIGLRLTVPLDLRGDSETAIASLRLRRERLRQEALQRFVAGEVRQGITDFTTALAQRDYLRIALTFAERDVADARARFAAGTTSNSDLAEAQRRRIAAAIAVIDGDALLAAATVQLTAALGITTGMRASP